MTVAPEDDDRMSFLTHNLPRYGREDFYVTCRRDGQGALELITVLAQWMLDDPDKHLPTGETVGRSPDEKLRVQRVPSPTGSGATVIKLDMP